jgi:hypothetical protein
METLNSDSTDEDVCAALNRSGFGDLVDSFRGLHYFVSTFYIIQFFGIISRIALIFFVFL